MLQVRSTVTVKDDPIVLHLHGCNSDAVSGSGELSFLVQHLFVHVATGRELSVREQRLGLAERKRPVRESLLRLKVAQQVAASPLRDGSGRELNASRVKLRRDVGGRSLLAHNKDLRCRWRV